MAGRGTKYYRKNEAEAMNRLGLKETINSGAGWVQKEDGESDMFLCQLKSTDAQSISIKQNDLHVLENNASISHKTPVFAIQFLNTGEMWLMISEDEFKAYKEFRENQKNETFFDFDIDKSVEEEYNYNCQMEKNKKTECSHLAREQYRRQQEEEREQRAREEHERAKKLRKKRSELWKAKSLNKQE